MLKAAGLRWPNLFPGPPLSPAERAALNKVHEERDSARRRLHALHGEGCDRLHALRAIVDDLAPRLMHIPDGREADRLITLLHQAIDDARYLDRALILVERGIGRS